jgi:hypothetical protein
MDFREWLILTERALIDPVVAQSYERGFRQGLEDLIARTRNPQLRSTFAAMRDCPIRTGTGCSSFTDYILGALIRHGCHQRCDPEEALAYSYSQMMMPTNMAGKPKATLFGNFDESRPFNPGDNPLEARFKTAVGNAVRSICSGAVRRLRTVEPRPAGTLSIAPGRQRGDGVAGMISPEEIPDRPGDRAEREMVADLEQLLRVRQRQNPDLPIVDLFMALISGELPTTRLQRAKWGKARADAARKTIVAAVEDYARATDNWHLLRLLDRFRDFDPTKPDPNARRSRFRERPAKPPKPKVEMSPTEMNYRRIVELMERLGRSLTTAQAGHWKRRWTERPPRDPASPHPNRLADTLANMVADGVLELRQTRAGGKLYVPGPRYGEFVAAGEPVET